MTRFGAAGIDASGAFGLAGTGMDISSPNRVGNRLLTESGSFSLALLNLVDNRTLGARSVRRFQNDNRDAWVSFKRVVERYALIYGF